MAVLTLRMFELMNEEFGRYPYPQFSVIQVEMGVWNIYQHHGLRKWSQRQSGRISGLVVHESVHSWYYGVLGFDEQRYA